MSSRTRRCLSLARDIDSVKIRVEYKVEQSDSRPLNKALYQALAPTPICPHMLTNRPVLVPETSVIRVKSNGPDGSVYLTIDGQVGNPIREGDTVVCHSTQYSLLLIRPPRMMFFDVLRQKLKWGER